MSNDDYVLALEKENEKLRQKVADQQKELGEYEKICYDNQNQRFSIYCNNFLKNK